MFSRVILAVACVSPPFLSPQSILRVPALPRLHENAHALRGKSWMTPIVKSACPSEPTGPASCLSWDMGSWVVLRFWGQSPALLATLSCGRLQGLPWSGGGPYCPGGAPILSGLPRQGLPLCLSRPHFPKALSHPAPSAGRPVTSSVGLGF